MNNHIKKNGRPKSRPENGAPVEGEILAILRRLSPDERLEALELLSALQQQEGGGAYATPYRPR